MKPKIGRPKVKDANKRVNLSCTVAPATKKKLRALGKIGGIGKVIDGFAATIPQA